jgi:glutamyl-tRNA synthetase
LKWHVSTTFDMLSAARETIAKVGAVSFESEELETALRALAAERGWKVGDLFMALRIATTGKTATPPLLEIFVALGYERTLARLDRGRQRLEAAPPG